LAWGPWNGEFGPRAFFPGVWHRVTELSERPEVRIGGTVCCTSIFLHATAFKFLLKSGEGKNNIKNKEKKKEEGVRITCAAAYSGVHF
jgi:hypothetical protein